ncbi:hypothetical protein IJH23_01025 [Candidatus Saccharibacteria bacterium]|nr:hypothetical protein [Candidatus Saccharibacteria bacterium]
MNKDVIYIEPEDDITDIITKIENSKEKIIALVPPKKAGILRSIVNIKLLVKAGTAAKKTIVLVTTDPSIIKLAASVKLPVTKDLTTAPTIPDEERVAPIETTSKEKLDENLGDEKEEKDSDGDEAEEESEDDSDEKKDEEESASEVTEKTELEDEKKQSKNGKKVKKEKKGDGKIKAWFFDHKKLAIFGGIFGVALILVLIWAFVIAPAATVTVGIRTVANNFSETVSFTETLTEEKVEEGKFYLTAEKLEMPSVVEFEATGQKNVGERAKGSVIAIADFDYNGSVSIAKGTVFTIGDYSFLADENTTLSWDGSLSSCEKIEDKKCIISARVNVTAQAPGAAYNIEKSSAGWKTAALVRVYSDKAMEGGSDQMITIVTQADIDKAKAELTTSNEADNKKKIFERIGEKSEGAFILESSFTQSTSEVTSTPAVGEEVKEGVKPKISVTTTASVFTIDKTKIEEFITEKAKISESQKIYEMRDPFIENFVKIEGGYTGKLKTSYIAGPKITENDVIEIIKGKGLGQAQHDLKDIDGVASMRIDTSYPWVMSIPGDPNKITVILEVQE